MKMAGLLAGNAWLMFAMFAWLGRHTASTNVLHYTLLEKSVSYSRGEYQFCVGLMVIAAIVCFITAWWPSDAPSETH